MAKTLSCREAGSDCDYIARADTEEELFAKAKEHGREVHSMTEFPPELVDKMKSLIRED